MATVAMIVDQSFEDSELRVPYDHLQRSGHRPVIVGKRAGERVAGKRGGEVVVTDLSIDQTRADEIAALVIPGGYSPDRLRTNAAMVRLVRDVFLRQKPIAAICHGGSMLVEAGVVDGRTVTSWPSIRTDLVNAGAVWIDRDVVEDGNLITSRKPEDLEAFCAALLRQLDAGIAPRFGSPWTYQNVWRARDAARVLLDQLELDAFLFGVEPRDGRWEISVEYVAETGWKSAVLRVDDASLAASRRDAAVRQRLMAAWAKALAGAKRAPGP